MTNKPEPAGSPDVFSELGVYMLTALFALVAAFLAGWFTYAHFHPGTVQIVYRVREPSYDEVHVMAYDFMRDNPKVRLEMCSKRFVPVMDGGVK